MPAGINERLGRNLRVTKLNERGEVVFGWQGQLSAAGRHCRQLRACFGTPPHPVGRLTFQPGDLFLETYYDDRWYNFFEVHEGEAGPVKCWYFNICRPAVFQGDEIRWEDLALDVLIYPQGDAELLDEDEFAALALDEPTRRKCRRTAEMLMSAEWRAAFLSSHAF